MNTFMKLFGLKAEPDGHQFKRSILRDAWDTLIADSLEYSGEMAKLWDMDISYPLYAKWGAIIIAQFVESVYKPVRQFLQGKYHGSVSSFPSTIQLRINKSDDFPVRGPLLEQLKLSPLYPVGVNVDTKNGTLASPDNLPRGFQGEVLEKSPRQVHIDALTDTLFKITFNELKEMTDRSTGRSLKIVSFSGEDARTAIVSGSLRLHRENILCGRNAGSLYSKEDANIIRLNDDTMPEDFARISVMGTAVKVEWLDNSVTGLLDGALLRADGSQVTFPLSSRLRIGEDGLYGFVTFRLD